MGTCFNCKKEISLKDGEVNCPSCGEPPYQCWNCKADITGETEECPVCNFFVCPSCGVCSKDCILPELIIATREMRHREMVEYIYSSIKTPDRRTCHQGIPISYAHGKLKNMALRLKGFRVKNKEDAEAFEKRFEKIEGFPINKTWVISQEKEDGEYGIEFREVSNLAVCMGMAKKETIEKKNSESKIINKYELFTRIDIEPCNNRNWDDLISSYCYKCKQPFERGVPYCPTCIYEKGKDKGQPVKLFERKSKVHFCQLNRKDFIKNKEVV